MERAVLVVGLTMAILDHDQLECRNKHGQRIQRVRAVRILMALCAYWRTSRRGGELGDRVGIAPDQIVDSGAKRDQQGFRRSRCKI